MIHVRDIGGRKLAFWINNVNFPSDRKTLVFIHGAGLDHTNWIRQYTSLKDTFNIAAVDLPGHGRSEGPGEQDISSYAEWVKKVLDDLQIPAPILIGHSLGAAICLSFAIRHGPEAAALVSVGGGVKMPVIPIVLEGLRKNPQAIIGLMVKFSVAKKHCERFSTLITDSLPSIKPDILYGDLLACNRLDISEAIEGIHIPVLVVCGMEDKMTPPSFSQFLRDHIPGAQFSLIKDAGHFVMFENPEAFNNDLLGFVKAIS